MKIRAAVVRKKGGPFLIEELELDEPREDEVIVRIAGAGLCHTDLAARDQLVPSPFPIVLGHEGSGIVEKIGKRVQKVKPGDHVVLSYVACGACGPCRKGMEHICLKSFEYNFLGARPDGSRTMRKGKEVINGSFFGQSSFATHALASERNTVKVADDVPIEGLGPMGCGVQTGAGGVINALSAKPGSTLVVFGTGGVGMSAVMAGVLCGCSRIIAVDVKETRLKAALELGATHVINPSQSDPVEAIRQITGEGAEYTLDTTGIPAVINQAVEALAVGGRCGLIGISTPDACLETPIGALMPGRSIFGIIEGNAVSDVFIPEMVELHKQGRFPIDRMITFYDLDRINEAVEDAESGRTLKAVLRP